MEVYHLRALACVCVCLVAQIESRGPPPGLGPIFDGFVESVLGCQSSPLSCSTEKSNTSEACSSLMTSYFQIMTQGPVPKAPIRNDTEVGHRTRKSKPAQRNRTTTARPHPIVGSGDEDDDQQSSNGTAVSGSTVASTTPTTTKRFAGQQSPQQQPVRDRNLAKRSPHNHHGNHFGRRQRNDDDDHEGSFLQAPKRNVNEEIRKKFCCFLLSQETMRTQCCSNLKDLCNDLIKTPEEEERERNRGPPPFWPFFGPPPPGRGHGRRGPPDREGSSSQVSSEEGNGGLDVYDGLFIPGGPPRGPPPGGPGSDYNADSFLGGSDDFGGSIFSRMMNMFRRNLPW